MNPHKLESPRAEAFATMLLILLFGTVCLGCGFATAVAWSRDPIDTPRVAHAIQRA